jgi:chemotaxis methyl-accepting protein methylase
MATDAEARPRSLPPEDSAFAALLAKISRDRGFGCSSYKERCLKRRVAVRMRARGVLLYDDYARLLDSDDGEYDKLLQALTINVTKLFRNWDVYAGIAEHVVPAVWRDSASSIRVWSAGCAGGQEAYSLGVLFHRHAETTNTLSRLSRLRIVGTDIDRPSLDAARRGEFEAADFLDTPADLRDRYFAPEAPFAIEQDVRRLVRFSESDLLKDAPPFAQHDLIVCRNVLIYLDRPSQAKLFALFHGALAPNGFLVLGKVETLLGPMRSKFVALHPRERIFQRA